MLFKQLPLQYILSLRRFEKLSRLIDKFGHNLFTFIIYNVHFFLSLDFHRSIDAGMALQLGTYFGVNNYKQINLKICIHVKYRLL